MELNRPLQRGDAAEPKSGKSDSSQNLERTRYPWWSKSCLKNPSYGEEQYLTRPSVSRNHKMEVDVHELPEEPHQSGTRTNSLKTRSENIVGCHEEVKDKIQKTLKLLTLRDPRNLIQFWSPCSVGKFKLLKTVDQPFGLGIPDEGLRNYRRESQRNWFPVDEECEEDDLSPVVRVFRRRLPEWTSDITNYFSKNHPQKDCAVRWNLHGYLVLPVFDSFTKLCVGVLEFVTSSKYIDCAYEVQEVHRTLKAENLTSPQAFDYPTSYVDDENRQHKLDEIFRILKEICDTHKLPLAQTWTVSSMSSFVVTERNIKKTCSSFSSSCIGKICMSTTALPFYVHDLRFWPFREACREHHLLKSQGVVGRALSSHGSCFCGDVTKLGEDEYSLVHYARMSGLTSCFAIYLHSIDDDYVLEFFLDMKEGADLQNLVRKLKLHVKFSSGFELGDLLSTEVIGMPMEVSKLSLAMQPDIMQTSLSREIVQLDLKDSQTVGETNDQIDCINAQDQCDFGEGYHKNWSSAITNTEEMAVDDVTSKKIDVVSVEKGYNSGGKKVSTKQRRKHKMDSFTSEDIHQYFGKSIGEASINLGSLSREIVQLDLKDSQTVGETDAQIDCINAQDQCDFGKGYHKNWSSDITYKEEMVVDDLTGKKIDVVTVEKGYNSGGKKVSTKQRRKRKMDSLTSEDIQQYFGKSIGEASMSLGVSRSTLKRVCRKLKIPSWPLPLRNKKNAHFGISSAVFLLVRVKRWSCSSNRHGFSARWWICGKHNAFVSKSKLSTEAYGSSRIANPSAIPPEGEPICKPLDFSQPLKESDDSIVTATPFSKPTQARLGIYEATCILLGLKRWRKRSVIMHAMLYNDYLVDGQLSDTFDMFHASPKQNVANVSDIRMVTVKATFKDDMIKFPFPLSSGLLELENQVAQRIKLKSRKLHLKYRDEDDDLILIACDADFHNLMAFSATSSSKNTIKLIVQIADD